MSRSGAAPIPALLKSQEPSIRWKTRVHVLGEDPDAKSIRSLREEIRQLVIARNSRRAAKGEPPLDVDEEIDRQLRDLGA